jgi:hypothetical protein
MAVAKPLHNHVKTQSADLSESAPPNNCEQLKVIYAYLVPIKSNVLSFLLLQVFY